MSQFLNFLNLALLAVVATAALGQEVSGATVTNTNDSGPGSLRGSIAATPSGGTVDFALSGCPCTIVLTSGDLDIEKDLAIAGPGSGELSISGNNSFRGFRIGKQSIGGDLVVVTLTGLTVSNGLAGAWPPFSNLDKFGGGIIGVNVNLSIRNCRILNNLAGRNGGGIAVAGRGVLSVLTSAVSGNTAGQSPYGGFGGGIANVENQLTVSDSDITDNHSNGGGGIYSDFYTSNRIVNSTISRNESGDGSAVYLFQHSTADIENCTLDGNIGDYGVIENVGSVTNIVNSTISANTGAGVWNFNFFDDFGNDQDSIINITNSTIYGNGWGAFTEYRSGFGFVTKTTIRGSIVAGSTSGPDVFNLADPAYTSYGYNFIGDPGSETAFQSIGDIAGVPGIPINPHLMPLALNGGRNRTHLPESNSRVVDRGNAFGTTSDQRGQTRPRDDPLRTNAPGGDGSDIGAVELQEANVPVKGRPFDFDGDGKADVAVFRRADAVWYVDRSSLGFYAEHFGILSDRIVPGDFDGDGKTDIAVYREGVWHWLNSSDNSYHSVQYGVWSDRVRATDFTGDGRSELVIYRSGTWWMLDLSTGQSSTVSFGVDSDIPEPADYDGDGRADQAVYRGGVWHINGSSRGYTIVQFGVATDLPVPADYDGDGMTDLAVYRGGIWYVLGTSSGSSAIQFGLPSDQPVAADYDGDGKTDPAVFRGSSGDWYQLRSTLGFGIVHFGAPGDTPLPWSTFSSDTCEGCWDVRTSRDPASSK